MQIKHYHKATSLQDAYDTLIGNPDSVVLGGGAWLKLSTKSVDTAIDLTGLGLDTIVEHDASIEIGAMVTLRTLEQHPIIKALAEGFLAESINHIMGIPFRNMATVGGSVMGRYAFSDFLTPLLTFDTTLVFFKSGEMTLEKYLTSRGKTTDILMSIRIDKIPSKGYFKKVSNTRLDFAMLNLAIRHVNGHFRIAVGSRPGMAALANEAMQYLNNVKVTNEDSIKETARIVVETMKFGTNNRASASYRKQVAKTYIVRGLKEVTNFED